MKVINNITVTDSILTSSNIAEPAAGETTWVSAGTYVAGDFRIRPGVHRVFLCLLGHTGRTTAPESDPTYWQDYGPTTKWAMFDGAVNTQSSNTSSITVTVVPGVVVGAIAFFELVGSTLTVTQKDAPGGTVVYTKTVSLDGTIITDWYDYFFEPSVQKSVVVMNDLLPYGAGEISVTISGTGTVKCGAMTFGRIYDLGGTQYGVTAGIIDYSTKTTDAYGTTKIVKRAYSKRMEAHTMFENSVLNRNYALLSSLRSTPCTYIGSDDDSYANPLIAFGYFKDFSIEIPYPKHSLCSIQIEGLI